MIGIVLFDEINVAVVEIHVAGTMMVSFRGCPAVSLLSEEGVYIKARISVLIRCNKGFQLFFGGIPPVAESCLFAGVELIDKFETTFPNHSV